jgi:protein involved in polysaccharide export with SLBB domain
MYELSPGDMVNIKNYDNPRFQVGVILKKTYTGTEYAFDKFDVLLGGNVKNYARQELTLVKNKRAFVKK